MVSKLQAQIDELLGFMTAEWVYIMVDALGVEVDANNQCITNQKLANDTGILCV